jgi:hypothetical protein
VKRCDKDSYKWIKHYSVFGGFEMPSDKAMVYAPVIIPTLCRDKHFIRCIESLRRNPWAKYTEIYIGLDYPAKEEHWEGYRKISAYLEQSFPEFRAVHVLRREKNVGAGQNNNLLRKAVLQTFDRYIYLEDDLEVSQNFLEYMDKALMAYEDDPDVVMVSGYAYPLKWKATDGCTVAKQSFNGSAWGRGVWRSKQIALMRFLRANGLNKAFSRAYRSGCFENMIDRAVKDYVDLCEGGWSGKNAFLNTTTDVAMRIYLVVENKFAVMPLISKVRNHGYDGSGLFCPRIEGNKNADYCVENYCFSAQPIDESDTFTLVEDPLFDMKANRDLLNRFDRVPISDMDAIWKRAKAISRRGKYGGLLLLWKRVIKHIKK